jgi:hypothetical protein
LVTFNVESSARLSSTVTFGNRRRLKLVPVSRPRRRRSLTSKRLMI